MENEKKIQKTKVPQEIIQFFTRQLATLLHAGTPFFDSLSIVQKQTKNKQFYKVLAKIKNAIAEGQSFAKALSQFPKIFNPLYVNMIEVGESRGELDVALQKIYAYESKQREVRMKLYTALTYPMFLIIGGIGLIVYMLTAVVPRFIEIFTDAEIALPLPTKIILITTNAITNNKSIILAGSILIIATIIYMQSQERGKEILHKYNLRFPLIGTIIRNAIIARFCKTFGMLHNSGIPLLQALTLAKNTVGNMFFEKNLTNAIISVQEGESLATSFEKIPLFPTMAVQMLAVGEQSSKVDQLALDVGEYYEEENEYITKRILVLIEPLVLLIIGVAIAFIAASFLLPLFKMVTVINPTF
ncbi:type II secretion system F family protein [Candidatus Margulisiibacteriota bacterium]